MDRSILSGVLSVASTKVLTLVIGLLTTPILYRILGPENVGVYATLVSVFSLFMIFVSSGVTDGVRKFLAEDREMECWEEHVVGFYLRLALLLAVVGSLLLAVAAWVGVAGDVFGAQYSVFFYILAVMVVVSQLREYIRRTLMGLGLERYSEPLKVLQRVAFVVVALPGAAYFGVEGALAGKIAASVSVGLVGVVLLRRQISFGKTFRPTPGAFPRKQMLTFNSLSVVLIFLLMSLYHVDILMLQQVTEQNTQVGYYKAALKLAEFLWFIPLALQTVFVHSTSELWSNDETEKISDLSARTTRYTFLLTGVMALGLAALANVTVPVYFGDSYTEAVTPLILLLPGALGFAVARPILAISQGKGDLKYPIAATGTAALINLGLNALLIPRYGMHGAAVATSVGYGSMVVFHLWSARHIGFDPMSDARLGRVTVTTVLSAAPIFLLAQLVDLRLTVAGVPLPLSLVVVPPLGLAVYLFFAFSTGALGVCEMLQTLSSFPEPVGSHAETLWNRINETNMSTDSMQKVMVVAGVLLFVFGIGFAFLGPGIGLGGTGDDPDTGQTMNTTEPTTGTTPGGTTPSETTSTSPESTTERNEQSTTQSEPPSESTTQPPPESTTTTQPPDSSTTTTTSTTQPTFTTTTTTTRTTTATQPPTTSTTQPTFTTTTSTTQPTFTTTTSTTQPTFTTTTTTTRTTTATQPPTTSTTTTTQTTQPLTTTTTTSGTTANLSAGATQITTSRSTAAGAATTTTAATTDDSLFDSRTTNQ